jgi:hypothetical protein
VIRAKQLRIMTPLLEGILSKVAAEESALDAPHQATSLKTLIALRPVQPDMEVGTIDSRRPIPYVPL